MSWQIHTGDCIEEMRKLEEGSVDAVVCDPPYGIGFMGHEWDQPGAARADRRKEASPNFRERRGDHQKTRERSASMHAGEYDLSLTANRRYQAWCEAWAREAFRVLKPGGHLLASCGSRTYHRLAAGVEDAGFEIRDSIMWLYGSGFPKSLDVSKAIDRRRDDLPDIKAVTAFLAAHRNGKSNRDIDDHFGFNGMAGHWTTQGVQAAVPTVQQWAELKGLLELPDDMDQEVWRLNGRKGEPGEDWEKREVLEVRTGPKPGDHGGSGSYGHREDRSITAPASVEASRWEGWGTALKPAHEPIVVARKPLIGTVAENVLAFGTGGLNIDACRVGFSDDEPYDIDKKCRPNTRGPSESAVGPSGGDVNVSSLGRWPANVVLDEEAAAELDAQSGESVSRKGEPRTGRNGNGWGMRATGAEYDDHGGASRFFYCAKTSRAERNAGLEGFEEKPASERFRGERASSFSDPRMDREQERRPAANHHPTVKPINLMRWLVRLVTPPRGVVLDPFTGSGSTGCAAVLEGFDFVGVEREPEYVAIAEARIAFWGQHEGKEVEEVLGIVNRSQRESRKQENLGQGSLLALATSIESEGAG